MDSGRFRLLIRPGVFSQSIVDGFNDNKKVHSLCYGKCNYRCEFCAFGQWHVDNFPEYSLEDFEKQVWNCLKLSRNFKFTGGEPTLNPYLEDMLKIVKIYSAQTFLDTNGSRPDKVKALIDKGLVDILGVSLKGLDADEAAETANITNKKLCWDNVFETIRLGSEADGVKVIVTYVACKGYFDEDKLDVLGRLLEPFSDVILKINNCYEDVQIGGCARNALEKSEIYEMTERFVKRNPQFKGRTVLFSDHESCFDDANAVFF